MNSIFANLFLTLQDRIAALVDDNNNKYIQFTDQEMGQLEFYTATNLPPVDWPCILIDVDTFRFKQLGMNTESGDGLITLRLGFPPFSTSDSYTPAEFKEKALYYYELEQIIHQAMQGWRPVLTAEQCPDNTQRAAFNNACGSLSRVSAETEQRQDFIRVRVLKYAIAIEDNSTADQITTHTAALNLTVNLNLP